MNSGPTPTLPPTPLALLDTRALAVLAVARRALGDETRAVIMHALLLGPLAVNDLTAMVGRPRTVISQHLRVLREAGLVEANRRGRWLHYSAAAGPAVAVVRAALEACLTSFT